MTHKTPYPIPLSPDYKSRSKTHIQGWLSLIVRKLTYFTGSDSPPALCTNPALINFILLSFCLTSGNSFPTNAVTVPALLFAYQGG